jgi:poly(hydroxyalkanoate) depolymerase family esterase
MTGLRKTLAALTARRRKLADVLADANGDMPDTVRAGGAGQTVASRLQEVRAFGANPGNLRMFVHAPEAIANRPALVIALHGCSQTAQTYERGTGWSTLADRSGFVVVYPEQQRANNANACFSWFQPSDIARDQGEAHSIQQMTEYAIVKYGIDRRRVFVTGLSAGGAMASVMLATYPDVYAGGAIIAGLPYGCAGSVQEAFDAMFSEQSPSGRALGDRVRAASKHRGAWPKISVWHGSADAVVKSSNADHSVRQWANVLGITETPTRTERIGHHTRRFWDDTEGNTMIEQLSIAGMAHGVPLAVTVDAQSCGVAGPFFLDVGLCSTRHIARSWGLAKLDAGSERAAAPKSATLEPGAMEPDGVFAYPNRVIAAALTAAGLQVPKLPSAPDAGAASINPQQIITMALKAAGLKR